MNIIPAKLRELADGLRWRAGIIDVKSPIAQAERAATRGAAFESKSYTRAEEVLGNLDRVVKYHVGRIQSTATAIDKAAQDFETQDLDFATDLQKLDLP
ncbi:hypothetical protein [Nocardia thailandica]|uniref:PE domain-containing protein n=1 Tax=Nocardia thailandica TaxID=257275 RepID=A0ABW6PPK4_9NOCA|nr:hypothetical protein [Nocardia thailandica]